MRPFVCNPDDQISRHFVYAEAVRSAEADAQGLHNRPVPAQFANIVYAARKMEEVRRVLEDNPIIVSSWFRSLALNKQVGGVADSAHLHGLALDFVCPRFGDVPAVVERLKISALEFDQVINEYGRWVHISFDWRRRRQVLRIE